MTIRRPALIVALMAALAGPGAKAADPGLAGADDPIRIRVVAPAAVLAATPPDSSAAAASADPASPPPTPSEDSVSWFVEIESLLWWGWRSVSDLFASLVDVLGPPSPGEIAERIARGDSDLWSLLEDAGYTLQSVTANIGLTSSTEVTFRLVRDLSPADRDYVEWRLVEYARRADGLTDRLNRSILHELLDASEAGPHAVESVTISVWPYPQARFSLVPKVQARAAERTPPSLPR